MSARRRLLALALLLGAAIALAPAPAAAGVPASPPASGPPVWDWPTAPPHPVVRPYRAPATAYASGHRGIDLPVAQGSPITSPDDGVVHFAGIVGDRPVLSIRHEGGLLSSFEPVEAVVGEGDTVRRGELVGTLAVSAGHCPLDCLHVGARLDGRYLSPLALLGGVPRAVLLPLDGQARG
jgi:murein DD-endopeptidase MepM/ murein hydrolase activator NlpD